MRWQVVRFEELYSEPSRNGIYKQKQFHGAGVRIVNMGELFAHDVISDQKMRRLAMTESEMAKSGLANGDLLFGRRSLVEAGAGKCSLVENLAEPTTFESSIIRVRVDETKIRPRFLFYWLKSHIGRGRIHAIVTGVNVKGIKGSVLKKVQVPCPNIEIQDQIVGHLRAYDDLIENNRRRIRLLEQAARLLYREWFVLLHFPGHENVKIKNGIPKGWEKKALGSLCFQYKKTIKPTDVAPNTPYIGLEHIPRRSITLSSWATSEKVISSKYVFEKNDILFGKIRPYFHKVGFALCSGITSSDAIVIRAKDEKLYHYVLAYVSSNSFVELASKTCREGAKMPRADWNYLEKQLVVVPSDQLLKGFSQQYEAIMQQLKTLALSNQKLAQARDLLLPRLMNGEIQI